MTLDEIAEKLPVGYRCVYKGGHPETNRARLNATGIIVSTPFEAYDGAARVTIQWDQFEVCCAYPENIEALTEEEYALVLLAR